MSSALILNCACGFIFLLLFLTYYPAISITVIVDSALAEVIGQHVLVVALILLPAASPINISVESLNNLNVHLKFHHHHQLQKQ
jgi:hypothetical protein